MNFGTRLKEVREILGFNQNEFAEKLNLAPQSLVRYEKNKVKPNIEFIEKLTNMFSVNSNWLLTGKGNLIIKDKEEIDFKSEILQFVENFSKKELEYFYYIMKAEMTKIKD